MAVETFNTEINGKQFSYTQMPASKSLLMKLRLMKILGPALPLIGEVFSLESDRDKFVVFTKIIERLMVRTQPEEVLQIFKDITELCFCDGKKALFDVVFTGNLEDLYELAFWVITKEYSSFLEKLDVPEEAEETKNSNVESPE